MAAYLIEEVGNGRGVVGIAIDGGDNGKEKKWGKKGKRGQVGACHLAHQETRS